MRAVILLLTLLGFSIAYPSYSYSIVPSYELPSEHHYAVEQDGIFDISSGGNQQGYPHNQFGWHYGPPKYPEFRTHVQHPQHGISHTYYNRFDNNVGQKFNFNVGKGTYNIKPFPLEYQRYTYVAPDGQLYITSYDKHPDRQVPFYAKKSPSQLFTGNRANVSSRPNTNFNKNIPKRTNQLGIPSAALASLAGGGLG